MIARTSGVFLNISSLMGDFGIGSFSNNADRFIDDIANMGFRWWQVLPITTIGLGNSPYSGVSAFAGNILYIDPFNLPQHLVTEDDINKAKYDGSPYVVNYDWAKESLNKLLKIAFLNLTSQDKKDVSAFRAHHQYWIEDYALYMALKNKFGQKPWFEWSEEFKFRKKDTIVKAKIELKDEMDFYSYCQYEFFCQWKRVRAVADGRGVGIFGDMPIYVAHDSVDVWANPNLFLLDKNLTPTLVAGVPPDYFAKEGQLWGNPLYNYDEMRKNNYEWLIKRILHNLKFYNLLRIDHFRGLYQFWAVPYGSKNAIGGKWMDGPKMEIWKELARQKDAVSIVAEDLGCIDQGVIDYLEETKFPGMRVLHFAFDGDQDNLHLPHNYPKNCVAYTGTHDNNTSLGWLYELDHNTRDNVLEYIGFNGSGWGSGGGKCLSTKAMIKTVISSSANLAIIPLQDLAGFGSDTRLNKPGIASGNWEYRATTSALAEIDRDYMLKLNRMFGRLHSVR